MPWFIKAVLKYVVLLISSSVESGGVVTLSIHEKSIIIYYAIANSRSCHQLYCPLLKLPHL